MPNQTALALPDALLVRYFRRGDIDDISKVTTLQDGRVLVRLGRGRAARTETWRDLGGGLGYVPDAADE